MNPRFRTFDEVLDALERRSFERPPALVANAHVTGLAVARALAAHDVPVIALDRTAEGVTAGSTAVDVAGRVTYPLDDPDGFRTDLEAVADALNHDPVAFGCMDEWVHGLAETDPDGVRLPFAGRDAVDAVLDKTALYARCEANDVPYPETYRLEETAPAGEGPPVRSAEEAADALGFPLVLKPALKREFEEATGTNVVEVDGPDGYREMIDGAAEAGIRLMAQERVNVAVGEDRSFASYRAPDGETLGLVGNARARFPEGYGTACVVDVDDDDAIPRRAETVLADAGYFGISEAEFVYDRDRGEYVLLDVNTRPWKWIGLPVAAGANLPMAAYADAVASVDYEPAGPAAAGRWVYLADYLRRLAAGASDVLSAAEWNAVVRGDVGATAAGDDGGSALVAGVFDPADPEPTRRLLRTELGEREYYCAC